MGKRPAKYRIILVALLIVSAIVHVYVAQSAFGHAYDMRCFASWARRMATFGAGQFYHNYWCDYPPGYIVVLGMLHQMATFLHANDGTALWLVIMKTPACLGDLITGWLVWRIASRALADRPYGSAWSLVAVACYVLNPAVIVDSALWGQVDSVLAVFVVAMFACYLRAFSMRKNTHIIAWMIAGSALWAVGITMKLQGALIAPAVFVTFFLLLRRDARTGLISMGLSIVTAIAVALAVLVPFSHTIGMIPLLQVFLKTLGSYQYGSVNALNFFTMVGAGWKDQDLPFMFLSYHAWGTIFLALLIAFTFACYVRAEFCDVFVQVFSDRRGDPVVSVSSLSREIMALPVLLAAVLVVGFFTFSVRVHERYVFYAISLLLLAAVLYRDKHLSVIFALVSFIEAFNLITVLYGINYTGKTTYEVIVSALMVATCIYLFVRTWQLAWKPEDAGGVQQNRPMR